MGMIIMNGKEYASSPKDGFPPMIYSDEEREIGVWRDGKPLYQKTISLGILECDDSWHNVPHNIQNFERLVNANTIAGNILNEFYVAPTLRPTQTNGINIGADLTYIRYMNTWMSNGKDTYITIQYTKTTDTAGSGTWTTQGSYAHHYSTSEKVIGTWTDGKPLYEITVPINSFSYGSAFTVAHGISNLNKVVETKGRFYRGDEGSWNPIPFIYPANPSSWGIQDYNYKSTVFSMYIGSGFSASQLSDMSVTIKYTKTTD